MNQSTCILNFLFKSCPLWLCSRDFNILFNGYLIWYILELTAVQMNQSPLWWVSYTRAFVSWELNLFPPFWPASKTTSFHNNDISLHRYICSETGSLASLLNERIWEYQSWKILRELSLKRWENQREWDTRPKSHSKFLAELELTSWLCDSSFHFHSLLHKVSQLSWGNPRQEANFPHISH